MRTVPFPLVMAGVIARMGLDPTITPASNTLAAWSEYISSATRWAWESYPWPELVNVEERAPAGNIISLDQAEETPIGDVLEVYSGNYLLDRYVQRMTWELSNAGITLFAATVPETVWVKFKVRPTAYNSDSMTNGDTVPYVLAEAVKIAAACLAQVEDGQYDKAKVLNEMATQILAAEFDKLEMKNQEAGRFLAQSTTRPIPAGIIAGTQFGNP